MSDKHWLTEAELVPLLCDLGSGTLAEKSAWVASRRAPGAPVWGHITSVPTRQRWKYHAGYGLWGEAEYLVGYPPGKSLSYSPPAQYLSPAPLRRYRLRALLREVFP